MGGEVIVFIGLFMVIFGIAYLHYSTRNKERLALIEKGADASIFTLGKQGRPYIKVAILNLALLFMGIGAGIITGGAMRALFGFQSEIAMPGSIFLMAGTGLLIGFFVTKKLEKEG